MATPRRRSSRLQTFGTAPTHHQSTPLSKLSSLLERDESPAGAQSNIDAVVATPIAPPNSALSQVQPAMSLSAIKTPQTASRVAFGEMHPSKIHHSTAKPARTLSPYPVNDVAQRSTGRLNTIEIEEGTPSGNRPSLPEKMNSPVFDFSFERPESDLSLEAQRIMDSVREEAAKIKTEMMEERARQTQHDGETDQMYGVSEREIKKPKGKSGRFSDIHKQEFKKMDSIATHASTWKTKSHENTTSPLKRSPSKAGLDETTPKSVPKSKSMRSLHLNATEICHSGKRIKRGFEDDASSGRPVSREANGPFQKTPTNTHFTSRLPSAVTTPTKASLARSASVKNLRPSKLPSLCHSASTKVLRRAEPNVPKTEDNNKYASSLSRFGGSVKSILRHAQPKYSDDPQKLAAGTHLPIQKATFDIEKELPSLPSSPAKDPLAVQQTPTIKRVNFSELTSEDHAKLNASPSISKIPKPQSAKSNAVNQSRISASSLQEPSLDEQVTYPLLATSPNITTRRPLPRSTTPGDFTFRANQTIEFSPKKVNSPGGTTIRVVRPSGFPTPVPSNFDLFPSIPHGMANKKRKHDTGTEDEEVSEDITNENEDPKASARTSDEENQPRAKKQRIQMASTPSISAQDANQSPLKRRFVNRATGGGNKIPKKGGMSFARLTALARPKDRR